MSDDIEKCPLCGGVLLEEYEFTSWNKDRDLELLTYHTECQTDGCPFHLYGFDEHHEKTAALMRALTEMGEKARRLEAELTRSAAGPWLPAKDAPEDTPVLWWWPGHGASMRKLIGQRTASDRTKWYRLYFVGGDKFNLLKEKDLDEMRYAEVHPPAEADREKGYYCP